MLSESDNFDVILLDFLNNFFMIFLYYSKKQEAPKKVKTSKWCVILHFKVISNFLLRSLALFRLNARVQFFTKIKKKRTQNNLHLEYLLRRILKCREI